LIFDFGLLVQVYGFSLKNSKLAAFRFSADAKKLSAKYFSKNFALAEIKLPAFFIFRTIRVIFEFR